MHYIFASESLGPQTGLFAEITEVFGRDGPLETYRNVNGFLARLRRHNRPGIMILLASDLQDLARLCEHREIFLDPDVVLLVPDSAEATIATAHSLRPNFLGRTDCDLDKVVPVLNRLLKKRAGRPGSGNAPET